MRKSKTLFITTLAVLATTGTASGAGSAYLLSGTGEDSTYKMGYAPGIVKALTPITEAGLFGPTEDRDGKGTIDNLIVCGGETETLCFGIGQGNLVAQSAQVLAGDVCIVRADLEPEYTFVFSDGRINDWGTVRKNWAEGRITMITSAGSSGSEGTLNQIIESSDDLADAKIDSADDWDGVIAAVKSSPRMIGFTHRYADPSGFLNDLGDKYSLNVFGLAERSLRPLTHENGEEVFMIDTAPFNISKRTVSVESTLSMGTPVVLFANCPSKLANEGDREYHQKVFDKIAALSVDDFAVDLGFVTNFVNKNLEREAGNSDGAWAYFDTAISKAEALTD